MGKKVNGSFREFVARIASVDSGTVLRWGVCGWLVLASSFVDVHAQLSIAPGGSGTDGAYTVFNPILSNDQCVVFAVGVVLSWALGFIAGQQR